MNLIRCDACGTEVDPMLASRLTTPQVRTFGDRDEHHLCRSCWHSCTLWIIDRRALFTETKETA